LWQRGGAERAERRRIGVFRENTLRSKEGVVKSNEQGPHGGGLLGGGQLPRTSEGRGIREGERDEEKGKRTREGRASNRANLKVSKGGEAEKRGESFSELIAVQGNFLVRK